MAPGQRFFGDQRTHGGWIVGTDDLRPTLTLVGLPESPPAGGSEGLPGTASDWLVVAALGAVALALVLVALRAALRPRAATAA
jgi:hypothetical protein